jgi:hypothetical protein
MGFNLQNERIQDTYSQLVQISGSTLVDGDGVVIPDITNISSVSSSYALTSSVAISAQTAVSATSATTASFATTATSATTASFATSAASATTASYIDPTFISASAAAAGFGGGGGDSFPYTGSAVISGSLKTTGSLSVYNYYDDGFTSGTSSVIEVITDGPGLGKQTAIKVSNRDSQFGYPLVDMRGSEVSVNSLSLPGNGTITFSGSANGFSMESSGENLSIRAKDTLTLQAQRTTGTIRLFGGTYPVLNGTQTSVNLGHATEPGPTPQMTITSSGHHTFRFGASGSFTGSFSGDASGLTEVPQLGQTAFFGKTDYLFDLPGDFNSDVYNVHVSQSGTYFVSCSGVPAGVAGPRVNIYYWPELLEIGTTAKVKFAVAKGDTLAGVTYRTNITGSSTSQWYWNSPTTSPAAETARTVTRVVAYASIGIGIGSTTMVKDGDGRVFFINSNTAIVSTNYLYTGDSLNPLI